LRAVNFKGNGYAFKHFWCKGTLSGLCPIYTLDINDQTTDGTLTVAVPKSGYTISNSSRTVTIYYYYSSSGGDDTITFNSVTADGSSSQSTTQLTLNFSQAITGLSASDITLSGVFGVSKGTLISSGPAYTLGISGQTSGGTLTVAVSKLGYTISGSPKTVTIYYYLAVVAAIILRLRSAVLHLTVHLRSLLPS
jgi:hypothetical protein